MKKEILFTRTAIRERVRTLARQISSDYHGKEPVLIGILNGVVFFFADLVRELAVSSQIDFVRAASYGSQTTSSGSVTLTKDVEIPIKDRSVLLVEDIVDTGVTLRFILGHLEEKGPESIKVCALLNKLERRKEQVQIDYCGFQIRKGFVVGYGLDYDEKYRYLPDIYVITPD